MKTRINLVSYVDLSELDTPGNPAHPSCGSKVRLIWSVAIIVVVMLIAGMARAQQSAFFNGVMSLSPAGYWPMHETNLPTASDTGDIETNYGTLGLLGNAYYPDWVQNLGEFSRGMAGPMSGSSGSDVAVHFTHATTSGNAAATWTNVVYIPHTSPLTTLNPPFSVEMWYFPTSTTSLYAWGQFGYCGLNTNVAGSGAGAWDGIGLNYNGSFTVYPNANGVETGLITSGALAVNHWYYLVVTCDASMTMALWTNGVQVASASAAGKYLPDYWTPLTIGGTRGNSRTCNGTISEFAVYTNVLQQGDILAHYSDATSLGAGQYFNDVVASNPAIFLRMNAPIYSAPAPANWATVSNFGTTNGAAVGSGVYSPGTVPGVLGGPFNFGGQAFGGVTNNSALLSGISSFADVGNAPVYNPTGGAPFSVSAIFKGYPCDNRVQSIAGHGTNSWELTINTNGFVVFNSGTNSTAAVTTGATPGDLRSTTVLNDGNWHFVVATHDGTTNMLFVDGVLNNLTTAATTNVLGNSGDMLIGSDPDYTNKGNTGNFAGVGWQFAGQICEVAFFTNALTASQVQSLYSDCEVAPTITVQPQSYTVDAGSDFTNIAVTVNGSAPLTYQWYTNGVALSGQTGSGLVLNPVTVNEASSNYYVIVQNSYGSVTSAVASLTVIGPPSFAKALPVTYDASNNTNYLTLYSGANPVFQVTAAGAQPITYYWFTNGVNVAGQNSTNFALANAQAGTMDVACVASNFVGTNAIFWSASVIADPLNSGGGLAPYPQQVLAASPIGYWRLNDYGLDGDNISGDNGYVAHDYAGGNDGLYTNVYLDNNGYSQTTDPSDTSMETGDFGGSFPNVANNFAGWIEGVDFAAANGADAEFTVEAWAKAAVDQQPAPGAIVTQGKYGVSDSFNLGLDSQTPNHYQFYVRDAAGSEFIADSAIAPDGNWHHLVGVCDEANGVISLYVDGHLQKTNSIPRASGLLEANAPMTIGAGTADGVNYNYQFLGDLNDVAVFNYALTASNVASQYVSLGYAPTVSPAPQNTADVNGGATLVIPAVAVGTPVLGYYWYDQNGATNVAAGTATGPFLNATLTVSNVPGSWNGDTLELVVTNAYGQNSYSVVLTVNTNAPIVTLQLPSPVTVLQGNSYTYSVGADGVTPLAYQWYNASSPISGATNASYTVTAGAPGSTTYSVTVSNQFGGLASADSQFVSVSSARPALSSGLGTNLMLFNPAGYWPMHEVQSGAAGDIEPNYGSLGVLGTGYYPDWATNGGGITRNYPGGLVYDPDASVFFNDNIGTGSTLYWTNELYVPLNSPMTTLNPPFTVECWCQPTNTGGGQDVWAQFGDEGFEAGNEGGTSGSYDGIQMVYNGSYTVYGEYNGVQTAMIGSSAQVTDVWVYLVVTCDANTNFNFYLNGTSVGSSVGLQKYTPDYWTPITIGGGRGGTRSFAGAVDEFAVYTNVLQSGDITAHYNAGLSSGPGQYFADVMASNPAVYLRLDSPNYSVSPTNFWPVLFNYGSAGSDGLYTPGTMPGILPGPSANAGGAFNGVSGNVPMLSGVSSFADAGYAGAYNPVGCEPFSVMAMFRGNPCDDRFQNIVGHSDASWRIAMNFNGHLQCTLGTNSTSVINSAKVYNGTNWHQVVEVYTPASDPNLPGTNALYLDGVLDASVATVSTNGILPGSAADVLIGSDPQYTNTPAGLGRNFAGQVCEVAFFTNALNAGEVSALYAAAVNPNTVPAFVAPEPPLNATVAPGGTLTLTAGAAGTSGVGYTWQINTNGGGSSVLAANSGAAPVNANLTVADVPLAWNGSQLELTVTNAYGTNIAFVNLSVVNPVSTAPPDIGFAIMNNQLILSWPPDHLGWTLEAQTNSLAVGISNNWAPVAGSTGVTNIVIPVNLTNGTVFYRLMYP